MYGPPVMPWRAPLRARAIVPFALLVLSVSALVSCATVAGTTDAVRPTSGTPMAQTLDLEPTATRGAPPVASRSPLEATPTASAETIVAAATPAPATLRPVPGPTLEPAPSATPLAITLAEGGPTLDRTTTRKLDAILRNTVKNKGVIGLQAAVRLPSGATWLGSAGNAELDPDRRIDDDTQFAIASVTKTFIAALILQLAEEGTVDLDAPFGSYFDDAPRSRTVTLRQLLSHTSGIYNYWSNPRYGVVAEAWWKKPGATGLKARDHVWTYDEMMDLVKSGSFKPGEDYQYSNTNFLILGKVAEAVAGQPLYQQLRDRFFEPYGLDDTVYQPAQKPRLDAAHGHWNYGTGYTDHTREARVIPFMAAATVADAAGAIASTARDLSVWADALYGGEVLSAESLAEMTTFLRPGYYGLGTDVAVFAGHRGHGHRGGIRGYESSMWYFPESGVTVVLLSNQGNWGTDQPMEKLVRAVLGGA